MQGCTQESRWHSPHSPFDCRVYRTVAIVIVVGVLAAFIVQGCRGQLELTGKGFSSPSSGMGRRLVLASCPLNALLSTGTQACDFTFAGPTTTLPEEPHRPGFFQSNYLSASTPGLPSFWPASTAASLGKSTSSGKAATNSAGHDLSVPDNAAARIDDLLEALITAAPEGEGCKAAGGLQTKRAPFYFTRMVVTAYCPLKCCCGRQADNITASGHRIAPGRGEKFAAAPRSYPFGTIFDIPGYGQAECLDRGGAIKGNKLDLYFDTHTEARGWGIKTLIVKVTAATDAAIQPGQGGPF